MKFCLLASLPSAAVQLIYYVQTQGLKFSDVIIVGENSDKYDILKKYAKINAFSLHFVDDPNEEKCLELVKTLEVDVVFVLTHHLIRRPFLDIPKVGVLTTHTGILPQYRGRETVRWAILEDSSPGYSVLFVNEGVDTGDIVLTKEMTIQKGDTFLKILERNHYLHKWQMTTEAMIQIQEGKAKRVSQTKSQGQQYFLMHPKLIQIVDELLETVSLSCSS